MAKKGIIAFVKNDQIKGVYIHRNAQLDAIGKRVARLCQENSIEELNEIYDNLKEVDEEEPMSEEQQAEYKKYIPEKLRTEELTWKKALTYTIDATAPLRDGFPYYVDFSSFLPAWRCRFHYTIDLDKKTLKITKAGLEIISQEFDEINIKDTDYCMRVRPCVLAEFPLDAVPDDWLDICKNKWASLQIVCVPRDEAVALSDVAEDDPKQQRSAYGMRYFIGE